jgi:hypothetical protein
VAQQIRFAVEGRTQVAETARSHHRHRLFGLAQRAEQQLDGALVLGGLVGPGVTFVGTDSHLNILGAVGAFGQGMGDQDIAFAFKTGRTWFEVPESVKVTLVGRPSARATAKDLALILCGRLGSKGLLGRVAELGGECIEALPLGIHVVDRDGALLYANRASRDQGSPRPLPAPCADRVPRVFDAGEPVLETVPLAAGGGAALTTLSRANSRSWSVSFSKRRRGGSEC